VNKLNVLIVEDEKNLGVTLAEYLKTKKHECYLAPTAATAKELFEKHQDIHVILMDIGLPDGDGLNLAREFRAKRKDFILLFLSALNDPETRLEGLELGADDYITKPFDLRELNLRLKRILEIKNFHEQVPNEIKIGALKIYFKRFEIINAQGESIPLSQKECGILELLYTNKNEVISRDKIIETIWGKNSFPSNRTVDNYIVSLRKWIDSDSNGSAKITSVRGIGYKLEIT
jgi:two-component system alkaline phosphatase synthesis response regulator PhoP